jgi:hypothetical protein
MKINPLLLARVDYLATAAGSKASTSKGKARAARDYYAAHRVRKVRYARQDGRRTITPDVREMRRLAADAAYRKLWAARARRTLKKATAKDVIVKAHDALIARGTSLGIHLEYPAASSDHAAAIQKAATAAMRAAVAMGGEYSGTTGVMRDWSTTPSARTTTDSGDKYSSRCTYRKTDACHRVSLTIDGVMGLMQLPSEVIIASTMDGLPLISAKVLPGRTCECVWVESSGKQIKSVTGAMAWTKDVDGAVVIFHAATVAKAQTGLSRKMESLAAQRVAKTSGAPLWSPMVDVKDVQRYTGWCAPGCRSWISGHIGRQARRAPWAEVAAAALRDGSYYGERLRSLLGVVKDGPYTFA